MRNTKLLVPAVAACLCPAMAPAGAQTLPDLQDLAIQGEQINRNAAIASERGQAVVSETPVDGDAGVYILTLNKIFQLSAGSAIGYTDNPTRTSNPTAGSGFADFFVSAGVSTRVHDKVDVGLSVSANGREFFKDYGPSDRSLSSTVSIGVPIAGPVYANVVGFGGYSFDRKFRGGTSFYGVSGTLSATLPLTPHLVARPGVGVVRQWSETSENNSTSLSGSIDLSYALSPSVSLLGRGIIQKRWYDNFYEDVTFVKRDDTIYGVSASLSWRVAPSFSLSASSSYTKQDSPLFMTDYDVFEGSAILAATYRF